MTYHRYEIEMGVCDECRYEANTRARAELEATYWQAYGLSPDPRQDYHDKRRILLQLSSDMSRKAREAIADGNMNAMRWAEEQAQRIEDMLSRLDQEQGG